MTDEEKLVLKAKKGDDNAYIELFAKYEKQLYRTAWLYVRNENDALDIVQEAAYRSFKNIKSLNKPQYFQTWLIKILISCAVDFIRKNKNITILDTIDITDATYSQNSDIEFIQLVSDLSIDEKNIVLLKYYHDYTFPMICDALHIPLGTAKTILYRALKKLRVTIEADFVKGGFINE